MARSNTRSWCRAEAGRGVLKDAVVGDCPGLALFVPPGLFCLVLLLLPFHLLPPFLSLMLPLGLVLFAALFVFGPALLGLFVRFGVRGGAHLGCWFCGPPCRLAWVVDGALRVCAQGEHLARPLAKDHDGGAGALA